MAEQIDILEIERDEYFAQVSGQMADALAARRLVRFAMAAHVESDHTPALGQSVHLIFELCLTLRPTKQHHRRLTGARLLIAQRHTTGNGDGLQGHFARHTELIPSVQELASSSTGECFGALGGGFAVAAAGHAAAADGKRLRSDKAAAIAGQEHRHVGDRIRG